MATGQSILNLMEVLFPELQLQPSETDVTKGLIVLNAAQDLLETIIAQYPRLKGDQIGNVTTTASVESTAFPTGFKRLDSIWYVDTTSSPNLPTYRLKPIRESGGHRTDSWYYSWISSNATTARPGGYFTNGTNIYWTPLPDATYTMRCYGFKEASDITASGTFAYDDAAMLPLATLAVRIYRTGTDDPIQDYTSLAKQCLDPYVDMLASFDRDGSYGYQYSYTHET